MRLDILRGEFAILQLDSGSRLPAWAQPRACEELHSITQTGETLSIVCESSRVPLDINADKEWRCIRVKGPLDFSLVGILASLAEPLARAGVPIFAISTFETDYLLVKGTNLEVAIAALESAGHVVGMTE